MRFQYYYASLSYKFDCDFFSWHNWRPEHSIGSSMQSTQRYFSEQIYSVLNKSSSRAVDGCYICSVCYLSCMAQAWLNMTARQIMISEIMRVVAKWWVGRPSSFLDYFSSYVHMISCSSSSHFSRRPLDI